MGNYSDPEIVQTLRLLCRTDLYFLLRYACNRPDVEHPWVFERCREVQASPNGHLDLWAREHYKSTIITFAQSIQDILTSHGDDPLEVWQGREVTIGIFSHTRPIAKGFLRQIMRELETNTRLHYLFPDILWTDPKKEAPKWSEDDGLIVRRKGNPKESTVEAWGLVDSQPTSKHFIVRLYDDVVTENSVRTGDMMEKTTHAWSLSLNLGTRGGYERYVGTRYHFNDSYREMEKRGAVVVRKHPATVDGTADGDPVLLTRDELAEKRRKQGSYVFGCQQLLDPKADSVMGFKREWLRYYGARRREMRIGMNIGILVDPANEKKKKSDYTSMTVLGYGPDQRQYVLDMVRDRLNLTERTEKVFELHKFWSYPGFRPTVYYEKYGKDSDIEHIRSEMDHKNYRFHIVAVGGAMSKNDRIRRLVPDIERGDILFPDKLPYVTNEGRAVDLVEIFIDEEYIPFPVGEHDDMLDSLSRSKDTFLEYPQAQQDSDPYDIPRLKRI